MLTRRAGEADSVLVLADGDVVGGAGLAEAGADTVELGTDGRLLVEHGRRSKATRQDGR